MDSAILCYVWFRTDSQTNRCAIIPRSRRTECWNMAWNLYARKGRVTSKQFPLSWRTRKALTTNCTHTMKTVGFSMFVYVSKHVLKKTKRTPYARLELISVRFCYISHHIEDHGAETSEIANSVRTAMNLNGWKHWMLRMIHFQMQNSPDQSGAY